MTFCYLSWRCIQIDEKILVCFIKWNAKLIKTFLQWTSIATNITEYSKETFSGNQSALWLQVPNSRSFNLFFSTNKAQVKSCATFKRHCPYPKDLNLDPELMWNQIKVEPRNMQQVKIKLQGTQILHFIRTMKDWWVPRITSKCDNFKIICTYNFFVVRRAAFYIFLE